MYYHVSKSYLGEEVVLKPKIPASSIIEKEGNIPRICVTDNPLYSIRSILSTTNINIRDFIEFKNKKDFINPSLYHTDKFLPLLPPDVCDFRKNNEHWYLSDTFFSFLGYICLDGLSQGKFKLITEPKTLTKKVFDENKHRSFSLKSTKKCVLITEIIKS